MRADDEGRPTGGEVYTRGGVPGGGRGRRPPPPKKMQKILFFILNLKFDRLIFFIGHFSPSFFLGSWKYFGVWYAALFWCAVGSVLRGLGPAFSRSKAFCKAAHLLNYYYYHARYYSLEKLAILHCLGLKEKMASF